MICLFNSTIYDGNSNNNEKKNCSSNNIYSMHASF